MRGLRGVHGREAPGFLDHVLHLLDHDNLAPLNLQILPLQFFLSSQISDHLFNLLLKPVGPLCPPLYCEPSGKPSFEYSSSPCGLV
jgi:hypothetical protein